MVKGLDGFKSRFKGYEASYAVIGGTACDILMSEAGMDFRATKDIDVVLIIESLSAGFGKRFWEYVVDGGYQHRSKSTGKPQFYRFSHPKNPSFPAMIELFSRKPDAMELPKDAVLAPIPNDEGIASLSAILLDDDYYRFLKTGIEEIEGIPVLRPGYLIPFKMKAWLDLRKRKSEGGKIDERDIRKHRNDVYRLSELLTPNEKIGVPEPVESDILQFIKETEKIEIDTRQLGIHMTDDEVLKRIRAAYDL